MKNKIKGYYQYMKTVIPENWCYLKNPYDLKKSLEIARGRIKNRTFRANEGINFLMAFPVNNWEVELLKHASLFGETHHISFESRGFFKSKEDWELWRAKNFLRLKHEVKTFYNSNKINILFLYLTDFHVPSSRLKELHLDNLILVGFNWDDRLYFDSKNKGQIVGVKGVAKAADLNLSMSVNSLSRYTHNSSSVFYWGGLKRKKAKNIVLPKIKFNKILFFGSRYGFREELIDYLIKKNLPIDIYGKGWDDESITYEELAYKVPRYSLNLGISTIGYTDNLTIVKGRDIEVPSLGGLYITNRGKEIEKIYSEDKNILLYGDKEECYRKANEVLDNPNKFSNIRKNSKLKADEFSWENRFNYLVQLVYRVISGD